MVVALRCDEADRGGEVFVLPREACGKSICELPTNLLKGHKRAAVGPGGETSLLIVPDPVSRQAAKLVLRHVMPG